MTASNRAQALVWLNLLSGDANVGRANVDRACVPAGAFRTNAELEARHGVNVEVVRLRRA